MKRISPLIVKRALPRRRSDSLKWDYGHCLVIAGSRKLLGAAVLTAKAALRGGAGLVTLATPASLQWLVYSQVLEALTLPLPETTDGTIDSAAIEPVRRHIADRGVTAVVVGPGLTRQESTAQFVRRLEEELQFPMVLDADAINIQPSLATGKFRCLTPHRRELGRLLGLPESEIIQNGPEHAAKFAAGRPGVAVALKGHRTKIFFGNQAWENTTGNPGMAKGGCGDVLAGLIGAFLAQSAAAIIRDMKKDSESGAVYMDSVLAGVYLHGLAGDLAAKEFSQTALNAEDLVAYLPAAIKRVLRR